MKNFFGKVLISNIFIPFCYTLSYVNSKEYTHKESRQVVVIWLSQLPASSFSQNTQVHKSYENKTVFIHTSTYNSNTSGFVHYDCICVFIWFSLSYFLLYLICYVGIHFIWGIHNHLILFCQLFCYRRFLGFVIGFDYSWFFLEQLGWFSSASSSVISRITRHGTPTASEFAGISLVTTLPAPITQPSPIVTPPQIVTFPAIQQLSPMVIGPGAFLIGKCSILFLILVAILPAERMHRGKKWLIWSHKYICTNCNRTAIHT